MIEGVNHEPETMSAVDDQWTTTIAYHNPSVGFIMRNSLSPGASRLIHWTSGVFSKGIMAYALFFSRFRLAISAISIGPRVNSPASAFRVSSLR